MTDTPAVKKQRTEDEKFSAWYLSDKSDTEGEPVSMDQLRDVGVLHWKIDADNYAAEGKLDAIAKERGYKNRDEICCCKEKMPNLEDKLKTFFEEHLHDDEEIRFILDGSGFFDVRDLDDKWIRTYCKKGDLIILPAGIWHRFTLDENRYVKAMRLFQEEPKWIAYNREVPETLNRPARGDYTSTFCAPVPPFLAWHMDNDEPVSMSTLKDIGVLHWRLDADNYEQEGRLDAIVKERGYKNRDTITCSKDCMPNLEEKLKTFFEEHLHDDEEIRFILDGSGYFDMRDRSDRWVRTAVKKGDLIILPAGIWHRFTLDEKRYVKAMRLFQDEPKWVPYNRDVAENRGRDARKAYESQFPSTQQA